MNRIEKLEKDVEWLKKAVARQSEQILRGRKIMYERLALKDNQCGKCRKKLIHKDGVYGCPVCYFKESLR